MKDISILFGGEAGFGIDTSSLIIAHILNKLGFYIYVYRDYPSLIRGGHTFSLIRASSKKCACHQRGVDFLLALNQDTISFHKQRLRENGCIIYDSDRVNSAGEGIPLAKIIKEEKASEIMRNSCLIGAFCRAAEIDWQIPEDVLKKDITKEVDLNLRVARRGFDLSKTVLSIGKTYNQPSLVLSGSEAMAQGLIKAGLQVYVAYPMTPASPLLHIFAKLAAESSLKTIHPESEIAVIMMALGFSYMGQRVAVGTSGGGFCLMTEGLSLAAMAELPVVFFIGQRPGPSTGIPTYSAQTELLFVLNAGHGEFIRFIVAPGDAEEAYYWSAISLNIAWKFQIPSFLLSDKNLNEGVYSFDIKMAGKAEEELPAFWDKKQRYARYLDTENGISPLAFAPLRDSVIKVNSYEHDQYGVTTEDPQLSKKMQDKRLRKAKFLEEELKKYEAIKVYGEMKSTTVLVCWGSNKGVCIEAAEIMGLKVVQVLVIWPFPREALCCSLKGAKKIICVESNATGQLAAIISGEGLKVNEKILKYDGRPFFLEELKQYLEELLK